MNKSSLVELITTNTNVSKATALKIVETTMSGITSALKNGDRVTLSGFGSFTTYQRKARNGRNPQSGEVIKLPARRTVKFVAGVDLKRAVGRR